MRHLITLLAVAVVANACGSDTGPESLAPDAESAEDPGSEAAADETLAGDSSEESVTVDGVEIDYLRIVPAGFVAGDTAPVLLALPPGGQSLDTVVNTARIYQAEALASGWVVVSPAAPGGELFFNGSERLIPGFLDSVETWVTPEGGGVHVSGISNGGISAFRIAGENPDRVLSLVVFPGFPRSDEDFSRLDDLTNIPIRLFAGERDEGWVSAAQIAADRLEELGGDVLFEIFADEGHVISELSDGVRVFDELDRARNG